MKHIISEAKNSPTSCRKRYKFKSSKKNRKATKTDLANFRVQFYYYYIYSSVNSSLKWKVYAFLMAHTPTVNREKNMKTPARFPYFPIPGVGGCNIDLVFIFPLDFLHLQDINLVYNVIFVTSSGKYGSSIYPEICLCMHLYLVPEKNAAPPGERNINIYASKKRRLHTCMNLFNLKGRRLLVDFGRRVPQESHK